MSKFSEDYIAYLKDQNEQIEHCCKFWRERILKVPEKSEEFNVILTTITLLAGLQRLNDDIIETEYDRK